MKLVWMMIFLYCLIMSIDFTDLCRLNSGYMFEEIRKSTSENKE